MEWIEKFKKATPSNSHVATAICLALAIHHLTTISKQSTIKLTRKYLNDFGLNFRRIKPYLLSFEKAGLIELLIKDRSMTQVKLVLLDPYQYIPNYKLGTINNIKGIKGTVPEQDQHCTRTGAETVPEQVQFKKHVKGKVDKVGRVGKLGRISKLGGG